MEECLFSLLDLIIDSLCKINDNVYLFIFYVVNLSIFQYEYKRIYEEWIILIYFKLSFSLELKLEIRI